MSPEFTRTALLRLDDSSTAGLTWVRRWARGRITRWKRGRKYRPAGNLSPEETAVLQALFDLEKAAIALLQER